MSILTRSIYAVIIYVAIFGSLTIVVQTDFNSAIECLTQYILTFSIYGAIYGPYPF